MIIFHCEHETLTLGSANAPPAVKALKRTNLGLVFLLGKGKPAGGFVRSIEGQDAGAFTRATAALYRKIGFGLKA